MTDEQENVELSTEEKAEQIGKDMGVVQQKDETPDYEVEEEGSDSRLAKTRQEQQAGQKPPREKLTSLEKRKQRKERINTRFAAKDALIESLVATNNELNHRLGAVESATVQQNKTQLEKTYKDAQTDFRRAEALHTEAFANGDGAKATQAMREMYVAQKKIDEIEDIFNKKPEKTQNRPVQQSQAAQPIPKAVQWAKRNAWFNPSAADTDSQIANTIAAAIASEGYDPNSDDFYEELDDRLSKYMPHNVKAHDTEEDEQEDDADERHQQRTAQHESTKRKAPPVSGGSGSRGDTQGKIKVTLPTAYINALKEAGKWDDPKVRNRMIQRYQDTQKNMQAGR